MLIVVCLCACRVKYGQKNLPWFFPLLRVPRTQYVFLNRHQISPKSFSRRLASRLFVVVVGGMRANNNGVSLLTRIIIIIYLVLDSVCVVIIILLCTLLLCYVFFFFSYLLPRLVSIFIINRSWCLLGGGGRVRGGMNSSDTDRIEYVKRLIASCVQ